MPKPLRNLYIKFDVNTLRHCGEMACVEEYLHTFGNSDITNTIYATYSVWRWLSTGENNASNAEQSIVKYALRHLVEERDGSLWTHNRNITPLVIKGLVGYVLAIAVLAFAAGWDLFLIEASFACDPGLDCFILENSQPIQNCSTLYDAANNNSDTLGNNPESDELTVVCFRFVIDYAVAASAVGGLFAFGSGVMAFISFATIRVYDHLERCCGSVKAKILHLRFAVFLLFVFDSNIHWTSNPLHEVGSSLYYSDVHCLFNYGSLIPWYRLPNEYAPMQ